MKFDSWHSVYPSAVTHRCRGFLCLFSACRLCLVDQWPVWGEGGLYVYLDSHKLSDPIVIIAIGQWTLLTAFKKTVIITSCINHKRSQKIGKCYVGKVFHFIQGDYVILNWPDTIFFREITIAREITLAWHRHTELNHVGVLTVLKRYIL